LNIIDFILGNVGSFGIGSLIVSGKIANDWGIAGIVIYLLVTVGLFTTAVLMIYGLRRIPDSWYLEIVYWITIFVSYNVLNYNFFVSFASSVLITFLILLICKLFRYIKFFVLYFIISGIGFYFLLSLDKNISEFLIINIMIWIFFDYRMKEYET